jgi:hypothetical protein
MLDRKNGECMNSSTIGLGAVFGAEIAPALYEYETSYDPSDLDRTEFMTLEEGLGAEFGS